MCRNPQEMTQAELEAEMLGEGVCVAHLPQQCLSSSVWPFLYVTSPRFSLNAAAAVLGATAGPMAGVDRVVWQLRRSPPL